MKILHLADIQAEIRRNSQRYDEYQTAFAAVIAFLKINQDIDIATITGDIFEFNAVNETERIMFIDFVNEMLATSAKLKVYMTSGNHDLKQRFNDIMIMGENVTEASVMDSLKKAFAHNPRVAIYTNTGFYNAGLDNSLHFAVWAHEHKFDNKGIEYSPWKREDAPAPEHVIELYHDNFFGAKSFNGDIQKGCEDAQSWESFQAKTVLAGHIHNPQQIVNDDTNQVFTYCSSLVMRDFGEGNYYVNHTQLVDGLSSHGFYVHTVDENNGYAITESKFIPVKPHTTRTTINIDRNFDYTRLHELSLDGMSPFKNLVRLYVIGNEKVYHQHSAQLIEHLSSQYPNTVVTVDIDASNIFTETFDELDATLEELVTEEQILAIAIPFIQRKIRSTKRIVEEDKPEAEENTIAMLKSQLTQLRKSVERKNVSFTKGIASNFLSFEDNVTVNFRDLKSLVKIIGTNGIGKTTLMKFIKWMLSDLIDTSQAKNAVSQNAMMVFNDKRLDTNVVNGHLEFTNNGSIYRLDKEITRAFKARSKAESITLTNWRDHLSGITIEKKLVITSRDGEQTITDSDLINKEISDIFGSIQDLESMLFTNAHLLDKLVKSDPDKLADSVLNYLGLTYFQDMEKGYDALRAEKLDGLTKPATNIEGLHTQIAELKEVQKTGSEKVEEIQQNVVIFNTEMTGIDEQIESKSKTLHQVSDPANIDSNIVLKQNLIQRAELDITTGANEITAIQTLIEQIPVLEASVKTLTADKEEKLNSISSHNDALVTLNKAEAEAREVLEQAIATVRAALDKKHTEMLGLVTAENTNWQTLNTQLVAFKNTLVEKVSELEKTSDNDHAELNKKKTSDAYDISTKKGEVERLTAENQRLQNSKVCVTCGQTVADEAITKIAAQITENTTKIDTLNAEITALETKVGEHDLEIASNRVAHGNIRKQVAELLPDVVKDVRDLNEKIEASKKQIDTLTQQAETFKANINTGITSDEGVVAKAGVLQAAKKAVTDQNDLITQLKQKLDIDGINQKITATNDQISDLSKKKDEIYAIKERGLASQQSIIDAKSAIATLEADKVKMLENLEIQESINLIKQRKTELVELIRLENEALSEIQRKLAVSDQRITALQLDIDSFVKYRIMESSLAIYKTFIGKSGFKPLIFAAVSQKLNVHMNDLLQDSPYKLSFIDGVLNLIDTKDPENPVMRPPSGFSGMQTILGGLSLFHTIRNASLGTRYDSVFIDEISGALNDGKDLTYEAINYQGILVNMIAKMRPSAKVYIVDHMLEFLDGSVLEVYPSDHGTNIRELILPE